ncbi:MAG: DUF2147 domain-containing protein [Hyphomicrobium sp.]
MSCNSLALKAAIVTIGCVASNAAFAAPDAKGVWLNDSGRGAIEIKDCGGKLCGHVVWTRDATDASRGCGKQMIGDVVSSGNGVWDGGWVYSPDKKRRFDVELKPLADGTLRVTGYAGTRFFSKTMIWTKAPADLQRCTKTSVEANAAAPTATEAPAVAPAPAPAAQASVAAPPAAKAPATLAPSAAPAPVTSAAQALAATEASKNKEPAQAAREPTQADSKPAAKQEDKDPEPRVADAGETEGGDSGDSISGEDILDKLEDMEFGNGYGVKRLPGGDCRLKVPYVTITVPCKK